MTPCLCWRHYPIMDVYWWCRGGECGHPCDLDALAHIPCTDPEMNTDYAPRHSCGCDLDAA